MGSAHLLFGARLRTAGRRPQRRHRARRAAPAVPYFRRDCRDARFDVRVCVADCRHLRDTRRRSPRSPPVAARVGCGDHRGDHDALPRAGMAGDARRYRVGRDGWRIAGARHAGHHQRPSRRASRRGVRRGQRRTRSRRRQLQPAGRWRVGVALVVAPAVSDPHRGDRRRAHRRGLAGACSGIDAAQRFPAHPPSRSRRVRSIPAHHQCRVRRVRHRRVGGDVPERDRARLGRSGLGSGGRLRRDDVRQS